jgi:PAS domain S-box-containing protein
MEMNMDKQTKVLIIHQNTTYLNRLTAFLRENDYSVITASNPEQMMLLTESMQPDIILFGNALTAQAKKIIKAIKIEKKYEFIPILILSKDVELIDRVKLEEIGIAESIELMPSSSIIKLKIKFHLDNVNKIIKLKNKNKQLQFMNRLQHNLIRAYDVKNLSELLAEFIQNIFQPKLQITLTYHKKNDRYDYVNVFPYEEKSNKHLIQLFNTNLWKKNFFFKPQIQEEEINDPSIIALFNKNKLYCDHFLQFPLKTSNKVVGIVILGVDRTSALSKEEKEELSLICTSAASKVVQLRQVSTDTASKGDTAETQHLFERLSIENLTRHLTKHILNAIKANAVFYFNYSVGFNFLHPQYCFIEKNDNDLFENGKPPVLMLKDLPSLKNVLESKQKNKILNLKDNPDIQEIASLINEKFGSMVVFVVEIGGEAKGFFIAASEDLLRRYTQSEMHQISNMIDKATAMLAQSKIVKQAQTTLKQLDRIFDLSRNFTLDHKIEDLLTQIAKAIRRTLGWNIVVLDRRDAYHDTFKNISALGLQASQIERLNERYPNSIYDSLHSISFEISNSYFYMHHLRNEKKSSAAESLFHMELNKEWDDRDWILIPIQSRGTVLGCIAVNDPVERTRPNEDKIRSLEYYANQAAVALENAYLFETLKSSESKYRILADTMIMGVITCDFSGKLLYVNRSLLKLLNIEDEKSVIDKRLFDFCSDKTRPELEKAFWTLKEDNTASEEIINLRDMGVEVELQNANGTFIPFMIHLTDHYIQNKKAGYLAVFNDLRPQKRIERLRADFNSMIVHDLRSPLNIIQGYIDIVRNKIVGEITEEQGELLLIAKDNVDKILRLISSFLTSSKMEAGKFNVKLEPASISSLIESAYNNHRVLTDKKQLVMKYEIAKELPTIKMDSMLIDQVLTNFISNAIKFTPTQGHIIISGKLHRKKNQLTSQLENYIRVAVKDSGVGISNKEQSMVFNKYAQTEAGKDASLKGTGLGLAIAKEIISLHHGEIGVKSVEGKGSVFYFDLPATES